MVEVSMPLEADRVLWRETDFCSNLLQRTLLGDEQYLAV